MSSTTPSSTTPSGTGAPAPARPRGRGGARAGAVLTGLTAAFLVFDGVTHLVRPAVVVDAVVALGFAPGAAPVMGVVLLVCVALHLVPRTSALGAVLITGYLGGAVTAQLRLGAPLGVVLFPVAFGVVVWAGLWLRDARVRALLPLRAAGAS